MAKLYELAENYRKFHEFIEDALDSENITEDDLQMYIDSLDAIQDSVEGKVENIAKLLRSMKSDIEAFKAEEDALERKRKYLTNKHEGLKSYTQSILTANGIEKVKAGVFSVRLQKNPPSVEIVDDKLIPNTYRQPQPDKILNQQILEVLKLGVEVAGAKLAKEKKHLRIT